MTTLHFKQVCFLFPESTVKAKKFTEILHVVPRIRPPLPVTIPCTVKLPRGLTEMHWTLELFVSCIQSKESRPFLRTIFCLLMMKIV